MSIKHATSKSLSSGSTSFSGGGDNYGGSIAVSTPVYKSDNCTVSIGASRDGSWTSNSGSQYSVGAGVSWRVN